MGRERIPEFEILVMRTLLFPAVDLWHIPEQRRSENQSQISGSPTLYTLFRKVTDSVAECKIESVLGGWVN